MFDSRLRKLIDPPLNALGARLAALGIGANAVTLIGLGLGLAAALAVAFGQFAAGFALILLSRLADGLDGAVARATQPTVFGGYLDIVSDFAFYGAVPLGFVVFDPTANGLAGAALLLSFYINGASFLGFAILAEKRGIETRAQGIKSLYYSNGLLEGGETIVFLLVLCLLPGLFAPLAFIFGALTLVTAVLRLYGAWRLFRDQA